MNFVPGRFYRTRGGFGYEPRKVLFVGHNLLVPEDSPSRLIFALANSEVYATASNGSYANCGQSQHDIIGEWQEPVTVTRWWFAYVREDGSDSTRECHSKEYADSEAKRMAREFGHRVGPIEEITTVVP